MVESIIALLVAFALGSFPTAFVAGKLLSRGDIRDAGSGNPGTLNAVRQYGKAVGLIVLLVDAGKGILAVVVAQALSVADLWVYGTALLVTLGHNFSPVLRFRGGKGAATVLGISAFMLWQITAISGAAGLLVLLLTRHGVLAVSMRVYRSERAHDSHGSGDWADCSLHRPVGPGGGHAPVASVRRGLGRRQRPQLAAFPVHRVTAVG